MTNAASAAGDRYYVYRPTLDLIGTSEGTDKGDGYNETLGYGIIPVSGDETTQLNLLALKDTARPEGCRNNRSHNPLPGRS